MVPSDSSEIIHDDELGNLLSSTESNKTYYSEGTSTTSDVPTTSLQSLHPADQLTIQLDAISHVLRYEEAKDDLGDLEYEYIKSTLGLNSPEPVVSQVFDGDVPYSEHGPLMRDYQPGTIHPPYYHAETYSVPLSSPAPSNKTVHKKIRSNNNLRSLADTFPRSLSSNRLSSAFATRQKKIQSSSNLLHTGMHADNRSQYRDMKKSFSGGAINMFYTDDSWQKNFHHNGPSIKPIAGINPTWNHQHRTFVDDFKEEGFYFWYQYGGKAIKMIIIMLSLSLLVFLSIFALFILGSLVIGPPSQPVGPYRLIDVQEGNDFFTHYTFYSGKDSDGSKGYVNYVSFEKAHSLGIAKVKVEPTVIQQTESPSDRLLRENEYEPFVYMSAAPSADGPYDSIRLEGLKRYNRGLFILDVRHMPEGCGTWPAFWLTDEANWPVNGEIDILEGVNTQTNAKIALHTTRECTMDDVPLGVRTGAWDTAVGVPKKNGELDMTLRDANDCFVYDPHQWLNQGCVTVSDNDSSIGTPLNKNGGGVFVLEWDPINRFMKSWVFTPHGSVPPNLREVLHSVRDSSVNGGIRGQIVRPEPEQWGLPYAYYPIGDGTNCPATHFRNMHLIFNLALCGSVAGNRFFLDCPALHKKYGSCENFLASNPSDAIAEFYWKIRGVYVFEREWEKSWV